VRTALGLACDILASLLRMTDLSVPPLLPQERE
jgi:hypothetical protein